MKKIRVLHIHGGMNMGGTESVIMNLYRSIDRDKFDFDFTTTFEKDCAYDDEIRRNGGRIIYIKPTRKVGYFNHCKEIYRAIKENGPYDVVHSHMNFHGGIVAVISKIAGVKKVVCHAHNTQDDGDGIKRKIQIKILKFLIHCFADELIACGIEAGEFVFGRKTKFTLLNNSVDLNKFKPYINEEKIIIDKLKKEYKLEGKLILGHIGRFSKQKNHKFIVGIIEELVKKDIDFKFVLIGEGELKDQFLYDIKQKKLEDYILFLGLRNDTELWMNIMDELVFPSLYEGLPVTLVEAQATGLPCIISNKVTTNVDLGMDLITFLELKENFEEWAEVIKSKHNFKLYDKEIIENSMSKYGYSLMDNTAKMMEIYSKKI